jgi:hypothetical protein
MAKPTERALKRKPMAVIMLTTQRGDVPEVPPEGREFEWFENEESRKKYFDQVRAFDKQDAKDHDDMAYMTIEIVDTTTMKTGRIEGSPSDNSKVKAWVKQIKDDVTLAFTPVTKASPKSTATKKVRARKKSSAAKKVSEVRSSTPEQKAARLKERLADKKVSAASETKQEFVVKKAATDPTPEGKDTEPADT